MHRVRALLGEDSFVTVPEVHLFDKDAAVIIMDDAGEDSVTLKSALRDGLSLSDATIRKIGAELGAFLARVHAWGAGSQEVLDFFEANKQARTLSAWATYGRLVSTLKGEDVPLLATPPLDISSDTLDTIAKIAKETTDAIVTSREAVVMGDFWPGNVLLSLVRHGEEIDVAGPPGGVAVADAYDHLLLAGDVTALPAIGRWLEEMPAGATGWAFVEVADASEEIELTAPAGVTVRWVHRGPVPPGSSMEN